MSFEIHFVHIVHLVGEAWQKCPEFLKKGKCLSCEKSDLEEGDYILLHAEEQKVARLCQDCHDNQCISMSIPVRQKPKKRPPVKFSKN